MAAASFSIGFSVDDDVSVFVDETVTSVYFADDFESFDFAEDDTVEFATYFSS